MGEPEIYKFLMKALLIPPIDLFKMVWIHEEGDDPDQMFHFARAVLYDRLQVKRCMDQLNRTDIAPQKRVYVYRVDHESDIDRNYKDKTRWIKMSNLDPDTTEHDIRGLIKDKGEITDNDLKSILLRHHLSGVYPSYCYVEFKKESTASQMVDTLNFHSLNDRKIWVTWVPWEVQQVDDSTKKSSENDDAESMQLDQSTESPSSLSRTVLLLNVHHSISMSDDDAINALIAPYGTMESVTNISKEGYFTGSIQVVMSSPKEANALKKGLNGTQIGSSKIVAIRPPLEVSKGGEVMHEFMGLVDKSFYGTKSMRMKRTEWEKIVYQRKCAPSVMTRIQRQELKERDQPLPDLLEEESKKKGTKTMEEKLKDADKFIEEMRIKTAKLDGSWTAKQKAQRLQKEKERLAFALARRDPSIYGPIKEHVTKPYEFRLNQRGRPQRVLQTKMKRKKRKKKYKMYSAKTNHGVTVKRVCGFKDQNYKEL